MEPTHYTKVLDNGYVELVERPNGDPVTIIAQAARVSRINKSGSPSEPSASPDRAKDLALIEFMMENKHTSPFEMVSYAFDLRVPLSIATQIYRHRTGSYNAMSHRYTAASKAMDTPEDESWYCPITCPDEIRMSDPLWKQGSLTIDLNDERIQEKVVTIMSIVSQLERNTKENHELYAALIKQGVAKEVARFWLPCSEYTVLRMRMNLHNLFHFLKLRTAQDAQLEIQLYAQAMRSILLKEIPEIMLIYDKYNIESISLSSDEIGVIRLINSGTPLSEAIKLIESERRREVFIAKYKTFAGSSSGVVEKECGLM